MKSLCLGFPICTATEAIQFSLHCVKTREWGFLLPQKSWDSEQPPNSSSSGLKENQTKINGNTYTDMYIAIKCSSKSTLVEWTTLFLQKILLEKETDIWSISSWSHLMHNTCGVSEFRILFNSATLIDTPTYLDCRTIEKRFYLHTQLHSTYYNGC